ncbi:MAG: hypothetical protein WCO57_12155 [Verrucomicrobiota bacterium]
MTEHANSTLSNDTINLLLQNGLYEGIPLIAEMLANAAMILERAEHLKVGAYERSDVRDGQEYQVDPITTTAPFARTAAPYCTSGSWPIPSMLSRN